MGQNSIRNKRKAFPYLKLVVRLQPDYAPAHAALAHLFSLEDHNSDLSQSQRRRLARHHLERGLALNEELAELHLVRGTILFQNEWRSSEAERSFRKALRLYPNDMNILQRFGLFLAATNRTKEALPLIERAFEIDTHNATIQFNLAQVHLMNGNINRARNIFDYLSNTHTHYSDAQVYNFLCRDQLEGRNTRKELSQWLSSLPDVSRLKLEFAKLGSVSSLSPRGRRRDLRRRQFNETHTAVTFAALCLQAGQKELAFAWLELAQDKRESQLLYLINTPIFESMHNEPRFQAIRNNLGLNFKL